MASRNFCMIRLPCQIRSIMMFPRLVSSCNLSITIKIKKLLSHRWIDLESLSYSTRWTILNMKRISKDQHHRRKRVIPGRHILSRRPITRRAQSALMRKQKRQRLIRTGWYRKGRKISQCCLMQIQIWSRIRSWESSVARLFWRAR